MLLCNLILLGSYQARYVLYSTAKQQISCNLPVVAVHHFCLTKGFPKTPNCSTTYQSENHLTVFYIDHFVPCSVVYYFNWKFFIYAIKVKFQNWFGSIIHRWKSSKTNHSDSCMIWHHQRYTRIRKSDGLSNFVGKKRQAWQKIYCKEFFYKLKKNCFNMNCLFS